MALEKKPMRVIRSEDLDDRLRELVGEAMEFGKDAETAARDAGLEVRGLPGKPGDPEELVVSLRESLEDEVRVARPVEADAAADEREEDREIAKRALMRIKLTKLRQIADELELPRTGNLEEVVDRIARDLRADPAAIAKLVVQYESDPPPERRYTSRIFQLGEGSTDLAAIAERLSYVAGRYIRTGIARWFTIEDVKSDPSVLALDGTYRAFRADAEVDDDEFTLRADETVAPAHLRLVRGEDLVEVLAKGEAESRALMDAFQHASGLPWRSKLAISQEPPDGELWGWHPWSVFMVDLLNARFRSSNVEIVDMTSAGFKTTKDERAEEAERPAVQSVRFQGRHLLDSRVACDLIVRGQALVELGMVVRFQPGGDQSFLLPLTIKLANDHVTVLTSFGLNGPVIARDLHRTIVSGVREALHLGLADEVDLRRLARQIRDRADAEDAPDQATMFAARKEEPA